MRNLEGNTYLSPISLYTKPTQLKKVILEGWPEAKHKISSLIKPYYSVRDESAVQNGLIFRGEREL